MPPRHAAAAGGAIDLDHLREMTLGDAALEREVLRLFVEQSERLMRALDALPDDAAALAHTLKGSARAIGAFGVAEAASALEAAPQAREALARLDAELGAALRAAAALLDR